MAEAVVFDDGSEEEIAGGDKVEGMAESAAVVSEDAHEPSENSAAGDAGAGEEDEEHGGIVLGQAVGAVALDTRPKGCGGDAGEEEKGEEEPQVFQEWEDEGDQHSAECGEHDQLAELVLFDEVAPAGAAENHAGGKKGRADAACPGSGG